MRKKLLILLVFVWSPVSIVYGFKLFRTTGTVTVSSKVPVGTPIRNTGSPVGLPGMGRSGMSSVNSRPSTGLGTLGGGLGTGSKFGSTGSLATKPVSSSYGALGGNSRLGFGSTSILDKRSSAANSLVPGPMNQLVPYKAPALGMGSTLGKPSALGGTGVSGPMNQLVPYGKPVTSGIVGSRPSLKINSLGSLSSRPSGGTLITTSRPLVGGGALMSRPYVGGGTIVTTSRPYVGGGTIVTTSRPYMGGGTLVNTPRPMIGGGALITTPRPIFTGGVLASTPRPIFGSGALVTTPRPMIGGGALINTPRPIFGSGSLTNTHRPMIGNEALITTPRPMIVGGALVTTPRPMIGGGALITTPRPMVGGGVLVNTPSSTGALVPTTPKPSFYGNGPTITEVASNPKPSKVSSPVKLGGAAVLGGVAGALLASQSFNPFSGPMHSYSNPNSMFGGVGTGLLSSTATGLGIPAGTGMLPATNLLSGIGGTSLASSVSTGLTPSFSQSTLFPNTLAPNLGMESYNPTLANLGASLASGHLTSGYFPNTGMTTYTQPNMFSPMTPGYFGAVGHDPSLVSSAAGLGVAGAGAASTMGTSTGAHSSPSTSHRDDPSTSSVHQSNHDNLVCRDEQNRPVDWFILYKLPEIPEQVFSTPYLFITNQRAPGAGSQWQYVRDGFEFMDFGAPPLRHTVIPLKAEVGGGGTATPPTYVVYSDQPQDERAGHTFGHSKGVLAKRGNRGFFLTQSLPKYPTLTDGRIEEFSTKFGQLFMCISFDANAQWTNLQQHVANIHAKVFNKSQDWTETRRNDRNLIQLQSLGGTTFSLFSKTRAEVRRGTEIYRDSIAPHYGVELDVEAWRLGNGRKISADCHQRVEDRVVEDVSQVEVTLATGETLNWPTTKDHSKWAVSRDGTQTDVFCIGDMNRFESQTTRPGGAVCMENVGWVANEFRRMVGETECGDRNAWRGRGG